MTLDPKIKNNWISLQKKSRVPVNAIGAPIAAGDEFTLRAWRAEGIEAYLLQDHGESDLEAKPKSETEP